MAGIVDKLSPRRRSSSPSAMDHDEINSVVAKNSLLSPHELRSLSVSLSELLKRVGDAGTTDDGRRDGDGGDRGNGNVVASFRLSPPSLRSSPDRHVQLDFEDVGLGGGRPPPFILSFSNLSYSVKTNKNKWSSFLGTRRRNQLATSPPDDRAPEEPGSLLPTTKTLLDNISGEAKEGEILAVMGASGSGKSTLIDALANRISKDSLGGAVTLNGEHLESRLLKVISAYVMQDDLLFPMLTVEETLMFAAEFRLPRALSGPKKARVQALIDQLGLRLAAKTVIGDEGHRGVSGGERRRVSIGIDIIHDPIILFLDEPTSGLDSTSAFMVVKVLRRIAQSGSIVVMSVHQPSSRILGLLDRLLFLSRGQSVYRGAPAGLPLYLAEFGRPVPPNENRCEFALDLIRELEGSPAGNRQLVEFHRRWHAAAVLKPAPATTTGAAAAAGTTLLLMDQDHTSAGAPLRGAAVSLRDAISASISRGKLVPGATEGGGGAAAGRISSTSSMPDFVNPFWVEMGVLTKRAFTNTWRMPELFAVRMGAVLVTGVILATIFWRLDASPKGVQERLGFFAFAMSTTFYTCADALPVFLHERHIYMRETAHNAYRRSSYVLSNSLVSVPPLLLLSVAFAATTFFAVGLAGGARGFLFYLLTVLAAFWAGNSFVTFLSGVVSNVMLGFTVVVAILAYFLLFSGFFVARDRIPSYWIWFHYLSLVKYPYQAVLHNEFDDPRRCFVRGSQIFDNSPLGGLSPAGQGKLLAAMSKVLMVKVTADTCVTTGPEILRQQAATDLSKWSCLWITVAWGFLFRILFYLALLLGSKNKRR